MNWEDIRYFLAVARQGGLTPAAADLGVSPATVSRRVEALERDSGMALFLRRQSGYVLTDEGQSMFEAAQGVEQAMLGFERRAQRVGEPGRWTGCTRLATSDALASHVIAPRLGDFLERHPGLQVELVTGIQAVNLSRRDADMALRMAPPSADEEGEYIAQRLPDLQFAAYAARALARRGSDWRELPYVSWPDSLSHIAMAKWMRATYGAAQPPLLTNSVGTQYQAARYGVGVAVLPVFMADEDPLLQRVEPGHLACVRPLWLMHHRDLRSSRRIVAMKEFILGLFPGRPA
ncbi:LysR family transcriptional regulator [Candidimonas humi]|uniref:LysR family transcriptional regulator n=1 Tax=Candidimonas humi TaxID=683355 RepID=A0ABV8NWX6_9BURK|nr:LysR family transcriptional regulator [Candidimonas humi]MBV6304034.1 LysR family transcriptional regulator [Candidimonas humi]